MRKGYGELVNKVCLTSGPVNKERTQALEKALSELPYLENVCLRHLANGCGYATVAKILDVTVPYVKHQEKKAIRHLRAPRRYYSILLGEKNYEKKLGNHEGKVLIQDCNLTTKTANTLERNGFLYIEELEEFIGNVPERFAYIEGLGKYGMSEILYYFYRKDGDSR